MTRGRKAALLVLAAAAMAAHVALLGSFLEWRRLLEPDSAYAYGDYSIHLADAHEVSGFLRDDGRLWGWSPWFFAGYPAGIFDAPSNRATGVVLAAPLSRLLGPGAGNARFKVYVFLLLALVPFVVALAGADALGLASGALATVLAVLYFQMERVVFVFCRYGMFHFIFASALAVLAIVAHQRVARRPGLRTALLSGLILAAALFFHPASPVLLAPGLLAVHAGMGRSVRAQATGAAALGLAALLSLPWALALVRNFAFAGLDSGFWSTAEVTLSDELVLSPDHIVRNVLVLVMVAGLVAGSRAQLPLVTSSVVALAIALAGSHLPIVDRLEPARFTIPAGLFAILPAIAGLPALRSRPGLLRATAYAACLVAAVPLLVASVSQGVVADLARGRTGTLRDALVPNLLLWTMPHRERPEADAIVSLIERRTDRSSRIALEQDWAGSRLNGFIASYVRLRVHREQIGGPHPFVKVRENGLNFFSGVFAGRRIQDWSDADLLAFCDRYNVGWILARKPETVRELRGRVRDGFLGIVEEGKGFALFRPAVAPTFLLAGSGRVLAGSNRISVNEASPGSVVLKYHFHPALECVCSGKDGELLRLPLERTDVPGDPDGFIRVRNGDAKDFAVRLRPNPLWPRRARSFVPPCDGNYNAGHAS